MKMLFLQSVGFLAISCLAGLQAHAQDYTLNVSKIDMKKTPQSGDWRAGGRINQESEHDNQDSWSGGENKYDGSNASLPVSFSVGGLKSGELMSLFIGLDDDAEDAGNEAKSEDKLYLKFKVFPTNGREKEYSYSSGDWSIVIHYTLAK